jgi:DNA-binding GntR family transcriptional regulator
MISENKTLRDRIYEIIKTNILCRKYPENSFLIERKLAEELFVSRTPIREAFKLLEKEGWITYVQNKGMKVTILSRQEVDDIYEVRKVLESTVAYNVCQYIDWDVLQQLKSCIERQTVAMDQKDWNSFIEIDLVFHDILLYKQQNKVLRNILTDLRNKSKLFGIRILYGDKGRLALTLEEHRKIYWAVMFREPENAKKYMMQHVQSVYEAACDYLSVAHENRSD